MSPSNESRTTASFVHVSSCLLLAGAGLLPLGKGEAPDAVRALSRSALFELQVEYDRGGAGGGLTRAARGFLLREDGTALTTLSCLRSAQRVTARFPGFPDAFAARYLGGDPEQDLALIRLEPPRKAEGDAFSSALSPLEAEDSLPVETWSLLPSGRGGSECVPTSSFLVPLAPEDEHPSPLAFLVDGPDPERRLVGAPIVDVSGKLRGRWTRPRPGLSIGACIQLPSALGALLAAHADAEPGPFPGAGIPPPRLIHDLPALEWPKPLPEREVGKRVADLAAIVCGKCDGSGRFDDGHMDVTPGQPKTWVPKWVECPDCKGSLLERPSDVWKPFPVLAEKLARASADARQQHHRAIQEELARVASLQLAGLVDAILAKNGGSLSPSSAEPTRVVVQILPALGRLRRWTTEPGVEHRCFEGPDGSSPRLVLPDVQGDRREVAAGPRLLLGVVAGSFRAEDGRDWVVVEHASVFALDGSRR